MRGKTGHADSGDEGRDHCHKKPDETGKYSRLTRRVCRVAQTGLRRQNAFGGPSFLCLWLVVWSKAKARIQIIKNSCRKQRKYPLFQAKSGYFVELLGGFELATSSLPTDWEDRVCCFQTLLHPLRSGVPSFPELLCPLSPSARFPVWVSVWVKGRREPAIAPPA